MTSRQKMVIIYHRFDPPRGGDFLIIFRIFSNYYMKANGGAVAMPNFQTFSIIRTPKTIQHIDASKGSF